MTQDSHRDADSSAIATEKLTRRTLLATAAAGLGSAMVRGDTAAARTATMHTSRTTKRASR